MSRTSEEEQICSAAFDAYNESANGLARHEPSGQEVGRSLRAGSLMTVE
jgi:hypothetical protein